jgi:hypothetical protein
MTEFIDLVPEDKREAFKAELASMVSIKSREDADKLISEHPFLKSARDAALTRTSEKSIERYKAEKLQLDVEEELKKRNPIKDPIALELEKTKAEIQEMKRQGVLKDQKAKTLQRLASEGLPLDLADYIVRESDEDTETEFRKLTAPIKSLMESSATKIKAEILGNQGQLRTGTVTPMATLQDKYTKAMEAGNVAVAMAIRDQMNAQQ